MPHTTDLPQVPVTSQLQGVLRMLWAVACFSCMDVAMKRLSETYPVPQVTFIRAASACVLLTLTACALGRARDLRPRRLWLHVLRGILSFATLYCFVWSIGRISLAHAYAIFMSAPLLITGLSRPLLGEHVELRRWLAVLVGLAGVLIALDPSGHGFSLGGGLSALASATAYALATIAMKVQVRTETGLATSVGCLFVVCLICPAFEPESWLPLRWEDWPALLGVAVSGALGQHLITQAFRVASPQVLAPLEYTALAWGVSFDALLWAVTPAGHVLVGAGVVIASGIYV
ncbi:MAG: DMT family transporter, partial [Polyangiales bacterium]